MRKRDWLRDGIYAYTRWLRLLRKNPEDAPPPPPANDHRIIALARELDQLARDLRRREEETRRVFAIVEEVESHVFLTDILEHLYTGFKGLLPFERIGCALVSDDGLHATAYWARSELGPIQIKRGFSRPLAGSSLETLTDINHPRIINDLESYLAAHPESHSTRLIVEEGGRSSLTCPLIVDGARVGFLFFTSAKKNIYQDNHQETFRRLARQISAVIYRGNLYQRLMKQNAALDRRRKSLELEVAIDPLTKIANRIGLDSHIRAAIADRESAFAVVMTDIDHFKQVNDRHGHVAGDAVLREFAQRLKSGLRAVDAVGRYGGEEFLIILMDVDATTMKTVAERLRQSIEQTPFGDGTAPISITASFGAAHFAAGSDERRKPERIVAVADELLYRAKKEGRNRVIAAEF